MHCLYTDFYKRRLYIKVPAVNSACLLTLLLLTVLVYKHDFSKQYFVYNRDCGKYICLYL